MIPLPVLHSLNTPLTYSPRTRELKMQDGQLVKEMKCPLQKSWAGLDPIYGRNGRKRHCGSCNRSVHDMTNLPAWLVRFWIRFMPRACVHFSPTSRNVIITSSLDEEKRYCPRRQILIARSEREKRLPNTRLVNMASMEQQLIIIPEDLQPGDPVILENRRMVWTGDSFEWEVQESQGALLDWFDDAMMIG